MGTVYHRRQLSLTFSDDEEYNQTLFVRNRTTSALSDRLDEFSSDKFRLADTDGEVVVDNGGVEEIRALYLEADGDLDVKIDSAAVPIKLRPAVDDIGVLMLESLNAASISVQHPTVSSEITVTVVVAGV